MPAGDPAPATSDNERSFRVPALPAQAGTAGGAGRTRAARAVPAPPKPRAGWVSRQLFPSIFFASELGTSDDGPGSPPGAVGVHAEAFALVKGSG